MCILCGHQNIKFTTSTTELPVVMPSSYNEFNFNCGIKRMSNNKNDSIKAIDDDDSRIEYLISFIA